MHHNIYVRWSAGIILVGNFDLQTQHHWSLIGTKLSYMDGALDTGVAVLWNNLPNNIKCALSLHLFKRLLKTFLFYSFAFYTHCSMYVLS